MKVGMIRLPVNLLFHNLKKGEKNLRDKKFDNVFFSGGYTWHCQLLDHTALHCGWHEFERTWKEAVVV
jgi:hypothetical protein